MLFIGSISSPIQQVWRFPFLPKVNRTRRENWCLSL